MTNEELIQEGIKIYQTEKKNLNMFSNAKRKLIKYFLKAQTAIIWARVLIFAEECKSIERMRDLTGKELEHAINEYMKERESK